MDEQPMCDPTPDVGPSTPGGSAAAATGIPPGLSRPLGPELPTAQSRQSCTAPGTDVADLVYELGRLARLIVDHNRLVMACEPHDWGKLTDALAEATRACRAQVDLRDVRTDAE